MPGIGDPLPHASVGSFITGWNWKESSGYGFTYEEGQNKNTVTLTIVKAGQDFYVQINGGEIVKETYAAFEGEATPGLFTMNYSGTWSDYSYTVGETAVNDWLDENYTEDPSDTTGKVKTIDGNLADWTDDDKTTAFDLQGTGDYAGKQFIVYGKYVVGDGVYVAAVVVHRAIGTPMIREIWRLQRALRCRSSTMHNRVIYRVTTMRRPVRSRLSGTISYRNIKSRRSITIRRSCIPRYLSTIWRKPICSR